MVRFYISDIEKRMVALFTGDLIISFFAFLLSAYIMSLSNNIYVSDIKFLKVKIVVFAISVLFYSFFLELYSTTRIFDRKLLFFRSFLTAIFSFLTLSFIYYQVPYIAIENKMLTITLLIFFVFQSSWYSLYYYIMKLPSFARKTLILGTGLKAERIGSFLNHTNDHYILKGYVSTRNDPITVPEFKIVANVNTIIEKVKNDHIDTIVMALTEQRGNNVIDKLITCKLLGVNVIDLPSFYELLTGKLPVEEIDPSWLVNTYGLRITKFSKTSKRVFDLFFSFIVTLFSLPFLPIIALLIRLGSEGPVFYKQIRVGEMGKNFYIYKFRTMCQGAEKKTGIAWAKKDDPRTTKLGRFLRKTRLDEFPQLFNVLKGDMSFIGPRPERPEFVERINEVTPFYKERHFVKPGITGWAQIRYPYGASFGDAIEKLRYDLYYIKNKSFFLDILIVFETIKVIVFRRGGR